ncbi:MAG: glycine--tRNA ligase subunit beta [Terriglobales bacterium]
MPDFLLEIGCEEIPARMLDAARDELERRVHGLIVVREGLATTTRDGQLSIKIESFSTPRRLAVLVRGLLARQIDRDEDIFGPPTSVAFKAGKPLQAAHAFATRVGQPLEKLTRLYRGDKEYLAATVTHKGRPAADVLGEALPREILALHWPKTMYWRGKAAERFVRPVRWLVAMLDGKVIPLELAGARAATASRGHRTLSSGPVAIASPAAYAETLEKSGVLASRAAREQKIRKALDAATRAVSGARWREDAALLATVVNLTEFPSAILGNFDREFLFLPEEVLVTVMRDHQKYFAVEGADGKLAPHFLAVLNTNSDPDGAIRHGHERVLRARFADARFFWEADQKRPLRERIELLKAVTFQKDLGSYYQKSERVAALANQLAADAANSGVTIDRNAVHEAAWLSKTDLTTELVKEFTELQGIVGGLYAGAQGFSPAIADAIYDHYKPESMDEPASRTIEAAVLSIADKADSIAGMFALGLQPTGSKDPFALRRQANGIIKTLAEHKLPLAVSRITSASQSGHNLSKAKDVSSATADFFRERLDFYLREALGFKYDEVNAILAAGADNVADAVARVQAVAAMRGSEDFVSISVSFKRMKNILRQATETGKTIGAEFDPSSLGEPAERELAGQMPHIAGVVDRLRTVKNYRQALAEISLLRTLIDAFFDKVMVMVEDEKVRANRLALLQKLVNDFSTIADFSEIVTEDKS